MQWLRRSQSQFHQKKVIFILFIIPTRMLDVSITPFFMQIDKEMPLKVKVKVDCANIELVKQFAVLQTSFIGPLYCFGPLSSFASFRLRDRRYSFRSAFFNLPALTYSRTSITDQCFDICLHLKSTPAVNGHE